MINGDRSTKKAEGKKKKNRNSENCQKPFVEKIRFLDI